MLTEERNYNFIGELTIKKSTVLPNGIRPKDDKVNWLFLSIGDHQYSFVYKMANPSEANFEEPFIVYLAFTMIEDLITKVELNSEYEVLRGQEKIGRVKLIAEMNNLSNKS